MLITLSRVARVTSKSFTKVLVVTAYSDTEGFKLSPDIKAQLPKWVKDAKSFVSKFDLDIEAWEDMTEDLLAGRTLVEDQDMVDAAMDLARSLRKVMKTSLDNETAVSREELGLIKNFNTVALSDNESTRHRAVKSMEKNVSALNDISLSKAFTAEVGNQASVVNQLKKVTAELGGTDISIDADTRSAHKGTPLLKEYNRLRSAMNAVPKDFVMNLVRSSGKPYLPVRKVYEELKSAGIAHHPVPAEFDGMIDDNMRYYTVTGLQLNGTPVGDVKMNPSYDPKEDNTYVCETKAPMAQNYSRVYTIAYKSNTTKAKFEKVAEFDKKADSIRKRWLAKFKADGIDTKDGVLAMLAELVYQTSARIGSKGNKTKGQKTYGITTILCGQYKKRGRDRLIEYEGKKAQVQKHKLVASNPNLRLVIAALDALAEGKQRKDLLITFRGKGVTGNALNRFLESLGMPKGVTVHKFRTLRGTRMAKQILDKSPLLTRKTTPSSAVVNKWLKGALEKVAKELGHFSNGKLTVNTAIANYIDPGILEDFYDQVGVRMPASIEKQANLLKYEK